MSRTLSMTRGDTKVVQVTISNLTANGLNGYTGFWFTAKNEVSDPDASAVFQKTFDDFSVVQAGDTDTPGVITCEIVPSDTDTLPDYAVSLLYDVQVKDSNDKIKTIVSGKLKVKPDTTRAE